MTLKNNRKKTKNKGIQGQFKFLKILVCFCLYIYCINSFPHSSVGKESACNAGDLGSIPRSVRSPGEGNGYPFQDSCLENPMDRGDQQATYSPWGHKESDTTEWQTLWTLRCGWYRYRYRHRHTYRYISKEWFLKNLFIGV